MRADLSPELVAKRLAELRRSYRPVAFDPRRSDEAAVPPARRYSLAPEDVSRRLSELRALCELTTYLHGARHLRRTSRIA